MIRTFISCFSPVSAARVVYAVLADIVFDVAIISLFMPNVKQDGDISECLPLFA